MSFEEAGAALDELADALPSEFFRELNGGILLSPEERRREDVPGHPLMMGCYRIDRLGRSIEIFYGSFAAVYRHASRQTVLDELRAVLIHEFTHHLESLAGENALERKDAEQLAAYLNRLR